MYSSNPSTAPTVRRPASPYSLTRLAASFFDNLPRLPTPPPVTQCCPWNKPCRHSILTLENEPITRRFLPLPAAESRFIEARHRHAKSLLPPPAPRLNPLGIIGDPPSLVLDNSSGSDGDSPAPETPMVRNRGNDNNPPLPRSYHSHPGHSHSHAHPSYATNKAVPAFATSRPNIRCNDDRARRIQEASKRQALRRYRADMTYFHMAQWEEGARRAREERRVEEEERRRVEEERRRAAAAQPSQPLNIAGRISRLKFEVKNARTLEERTELQQQLEMLLQAQKGR
ncbi:MAG: hypothetical protein Q9192_001269 [Flavoplaca navasiana]